MSTAKLIITAVTVEGLSQSEAAIKYGVSKGWVSKLMARYHAEGDAAFEPHSRRPKTSPNATSPQIVDLIVEIRNNLAARGLDAGPETINWHLTNHHQVEVSRATIARILQRQGLVIAEPKKRPKSSYIRFEATQPNECWQSDFTHYKLTRPDGRPGTNCEILTFLDDCTRLALSVRAYRRVTGPNVVDQFNATIATYGPPASTLTDNAMVYTTRLAGGRGGRNAFETLLSAMGITQKNGHPNHPQTQGKVERFQQTLKKWLTAQHPQPTTIDQLQTLIDLFVDEYNHHRGHKSLPHRQTPAARYRQVPKTGPEPTCVPDYHNRVRHDTIDKVGKVTVRHGGKLYHIGVGRPHSGTHVTMLIQNLDITIVATATGEILRQLVLDPTRNYQPQG